MCVKKTVRHRLLQLDGNHTQFYSKPHPLNIPTKPRPSNISNIGVSCGCGLILLIFIDSFPFHCYLPPSGSPKKQLFKLEWPNNSYYSVSKGIIHVR